MYFALRKVSVAFKKIEIWILYLVFSRTGKELVNMSDLNANTNNAVGGGTEPSGLGAPSGLAAPSGLEAGLDFVKQGCALIAAVDGGSDEAKRLRPAIVLLQEAAEIAKTVPDAGSSGGLRWRIYQVVQAQEGDDNAAFYKELRCSIHLGLAGETSEPVTLPCGHTFCKTCIAPFYKVGASVGARKCPQCREPITVTYQSLKVNFAIKGIVDHLLPRGHTYDEAAIAAVEAQIAAPGAAAASAAAYGGGGGGGYGYGGGGYYGGGYYDR